MNIWNIPPTLLPDFKTPPLRSRSQTCAAVAPVKVPLKPHVSGALKFVVGEEQRARALATAETWKQRFADEVNWRGVVSRIEQFAQEDVIREQSDGLIQRISSSGELWLKGPAVMGYGQGTTHLFGGIDTTAQEPATSPSPPLPVASGGLWESRPHKKGKARASPDKLATHKVTNPPAPELPPIPFNPSDCVVKAAQSKIQTDVANAALHCCAARLGHHSVFTTASSNKGPLALKASMVKPTDTLQAAESVLEDCYLGLELKNHVQPDLPAMMRVLANSEAEIVQRNCVPSGQLSRHGVAPWLYVFRNNESILELSTVLDAQRHLLLQHRTTKKKMAGETKWPVLQLAWAMQALCEAEHEVELADDVSGTGSDGDVELEYGRFLRKIDSKDLDKSVGAEKTEARVGVRGFGDMHTVPEKNRAEDETCDIQAILRQGPKQAGAAVRRSRSTTFGSFTPSTSPPSPTPIHKTVSHSKLIHPLLRSSNTEDEISNIHSILEKGPESVGVVAAGRSRSTTLGSSTPTPSPASPARIHKSASHPKLIHPILHGNHTEKSSTSPTPHERTTAPTKPRHTLLRRSNANLRKRNPRILTSTPPSLPKCPITKPTSAFKPTISPPPLPPHPPPPPPNRPLPPLPPPNRPLPPLPGTPQVQHNAPQKIPLTPKLRNLPSSPPSLPKHSAIKPTPSIKSTISPIPLPPHPPPPPPNCPLPPLPTTPQDPHEPPQKSPLTPELRTLRHQGPSMHDLTAWAEKLRGIQGCLDTEEVPALPTMPCAHTAPSPSSSPPLPAHAFTPRRSSSVYSTMTTIHVGPDADAEPDAEPQDTLTEHASAHASAEEERYDRWISLRCMEVRERDRQGSQRDC